MFSNIRTHNLVIGSGFYDCRRKKHLPGGWGSCLRFGKSSWNKEGGRVEGSRNSFFFSFFSFLLSHIPSD